MSSEKLKQAFEQSLADHQLSRSERKALGELIAETPSNELAEARRFAFEAAAEAIDHPQARSALEWLEQVLRLLTPTTSNPTSGGEPEAYFSPGDDCTNAILRQLRLATRQVDICVFTITDDRISDTILQAHDRGVALRIITDNDKSEDLGSDIHRLRRAGVAVKFDITEAHMHHKYAIFDGLRLLNGSFNWTRSAARENEENLVILSNSKLVSQFAGEFETLWRKLA